MTQATALVEVQEERDRLLHAILLAFGAAALGLLAGVALTGAIVVLLCCFRNPIFRSQDPKNCP